jgi:hypothetical protein
MSGSYDLAVAVLAVPFTRTGSDKRGAGRSSTDDWN